MKHINLNFVILKYMIEKSNYNNKYNCNDK